MSYLGKADCGTCGHEVDVRSNVNGRAYYKCGRCGAWMQHKEERGNRIFMAKVRPEADPDFEPEAVSETQRNAVQKPAVQPAAKPVETPKKTDPPKPRAGLFGGVFSGA
jgi:DNA-directed RNA polymerase subunit RPC12/RpoP